MLLHLFACLLVILSRDGVSGKNAERRHFENHTMHNTSWLIFMEI